MVEALWKRLSYKKVEDRYQDEIEEASRMEGTGLYPQELPPILKFIAEWGDIYLQYVHEGGKKEPTGVIEFIPLVELPEFDPEADVINPGEYDLSVSPFVVIAKNSGRVLADVRRFAEDKDMIYHHGIAMSRQCGGYGTMLLKHAMDRVPEDKTIVCFPDAAQVNKAGEIELAPNEDSFTLHLKAGFVLAGLVAPPVYDESLYYYSFVRPGERREKINGESFFLNLFEGNAKEVLGIVSDYVSRGFFGVQYNKETHEMRFAKLQG